MNVKAYSKFIVAIGAAVAVGVAGAADGNFNSNDAVQTVLAFLGAIGVYAAKNSTD